MRAVHLPGGNRFDDVRLDLPASYRTQDAWLATVDRAPVGSSRFSAMRRRALIRATGGRLRDAAVNAGIDRSWFVEFCDYWHGAIGGRPITIDDFLQLRFNYRCRAQTLDRLEWHDHLANWQQPQLISQTFQLVYKSALNPIRNRELQLPTGARVLEYGCSIAPSYRTWRRFGSGCAEWVLADIAGFPFHYARHVYARDAEATTLLIDPDADDPVAAIDGDFDLIIVQEVFEHLDRPAQIAAALVERLRRGGSLIFDYAESDGVGLDTPAALAGRPAALAELAGLSYEFPAAELPERARSLVRGVKQ